MNLLALLTAAYAERKLITLVVAAVVSLILVLLGTFAPTAHVRSIAVLLGLACALALGFAAGKEVP